ncbi:hypothetical protein [Pedobacter sp. P26]|uniref:hypothetical protein n=1 Tax=Pedobacter sp. P26 TaxID=3423956 RepID=UPI003D678FCB
MEKITTVIEQYLAEASADTLHRYHSWDHCRKVFALSGPTIHHQLHLGFYLASWGMYRGSGGLLQKNHMVHEGVVDIYYSGKFEHLKHYRPTDLSDVIIDEILGLKREVSNYYRGIRFKRGNKEEKAISTTDTLMSKVLLGTFGCTPAFDEYFIKGFTEITKDKKIKFDRGD